MRWGNEFLRKTPKTKPKCNRVIPAVKFHLLIFWVLALSVSKATRQDPFFPIAVIDNFNVTRFISALVFKAGFWDAKVGS